MSAITHELAVLIVHGYRQVRCRDCPIYFWKAPHFIPGGDRCEACRDGVIEHFKEESMDHEENNERDDTESD